MEKIILILFVLISSICSGQIKNSYGTMTGGMNVSGSTVTDLVSGNNGTMGNSAFYTNGSISFSTTASSYVSIASETDYQHTDADQFFYVITAKTNKNNTNTDRLFTMANLATSANYQRVTYLSSTSSNFNSFACAGASAVATTANSVVNDGNYHVIIAIFPTNNVPAISIDGRTSISGSGAVTGNFYAAGNVPTIGSGYNQSTGQFLNSITGQIGCVIHGIGTITNAHRANWANELNMNL